MINSLSLNTDALENDKFSTLKFEPLIQKSITDVSNYDIEKEFNNYINLNNPDNLTAKGSQLYQKGNTNYFQISGEGEVNIHAQKIRFVPLIDIGRSGSGYKTTVYVFIDKTGVYNISFLNLSAKEKIQTFEGVKKLSTIRAGGSLLLSTDNNFLFLNVRSERLPTTKWDSEESFEYSFNCINLGNSEESKTIDQTKKILKSCGAPYLIYHPSVINLSNGKVLNNLPLGNDITNNQGISFQESQTGSSIPKDFRPSGKLFKGKSQYMIFNKISNGILNFTVHGNLGRMSVGTPEFEADTNKIYNSMKEDCGQPLQYYIVGCKSFEVNMDLKTTEFLNYKQIETKSQDPKIVEKTVVDSKKNEITKTEKPQEEKKDISNIGNLIRTGGVNSVYIFIGIVFTCLILGIVYLKKRRKIQ
ncbi:MAG: hypothetical protein ACRCXZ_08930 [Patescibacteria group bacterium]